MSATYLFYDVETSGLHKCFDQILQFAAIRTDLQLNEIERHEIFVRLNPDTIPSPFATITHHIGIEQCQTQGVSELEAIEKIHNLINTPGTISLGYNTLTFDDELLRFAFYRHLLTPYTHQYANQCGRMDLYPMTTFFALFKPDALPHWPKIDGRTSLKLENLNAANHLATGPAHNALVDVEATIALAKQLKQDEKMWQYLTGYFHKQTDQIRCNQLALHPELQKAIGLMVWGKIGARHQYQAPVLSLGQHQHYKNQHLWLRLDLPELQQVGLDNVDEHTWVLRKKIGEPGFLLPYQDRYQQHIKPERLAQVESNLNWLTAHPDILAAIIEYHQQFKYPMYPNVDVDAALYQSDFLSSAERKACADYHHCSTQQKAKWITHCPYPAPQEMATRVLGRHDATALTPEQQQKFQAYLQRIYSQNTDEILIDFTNQPRYTLAQFSEDLTDAKTRDLSAEQQALLQELEAYVAAQTQGY